MSVDISFVSVIIKPLRVAFAVDVSSRTTHEQMSGMLNFVSNTVKTFDNKNVKISLLTFHDESKTIKTFDGSTDKIKDSLDMIRNTDRRLSGSVRRLDTLFRVIDQQVFGGPNIKKKLDDALVFILSTGKNNIFSFVSFDPRYNTYYLVFII